MKKFFFSLLLGILLVVQPATAIPQKPIGYVNDFAHILDQNTQAELNSLIIEFEQKTSAEMAVVTVPGLEDMPVEEYAHRLATQWGIGKKKKDNGILVLVAPVEHKVRIEVGYGLEPILPDGLAGEIIRENFIPSFKQGDFSGGIRNGVDRIAVIIEKGEPAPNTNASRNIKIAAQLLPFLFFIVFFALASISRTRRGVGMWFWPMMMMGGWSSGGGGGFSGGGGFGSFGGGSFGGGGGSGSW